MSPRFLHHRLSDEEGFTIVEVLVAAVVLVVGLLGTLTLVDTANTTTFETKAREQATSLQRELIESVRAISYDQLTNASVAGALQGRTGLADTGASAGWSIKRRGETYTVSVGTCSFDDARDKIGKHDAGVFCDPATRGAAAESGCQAALDTTWSATAPPRRSGTVPAAIAAACGIDAIDDNLDGVIENLTAPGETTCTDPVTCDASPADYKRVVSMVRWEQGDERRQNLMVTTISNPGLSAAPAILTLDVLGGTAFTDPATSSASFTATASTSAAAVTWYVDGEERDAAAKSGDSWTWAWDFNAATTGLDSSGAPLEPAADELYDGTYVMGARAVDAAGQAGSIFSKTLSFNRRRPFAPRNLQAGRSVRSPSVVELSWSANPEGDLRGYAIYRKDAGGDTQVCPLTFMVSCQDTSAPAAGALTYYAVAFDSDPANPSGPARPGDRSDDAVAAAPLLNRAPYAPVGPVATPVDNGVKLTWTRPDPEDDDAEPEDACANTGYRICHYNIYRGGTDFADRLDRTATGAQLEWTDTDTAGGASTYWVSAVDAHLAESALVPVTVAP